MNLLQKFLEENKENSIVIKFYNSQKNKIQKNIEKQSLELKVESHHQLWKYFYHRIVGNNLLINFFE